MKPQWMTPEQWQEARDWVAALSESVKDGGIALTLVGAQPPPIKAEETIEMRLARASACLIYADCMCVPPSSDGLINARVCGVFTSEDYRSCFENRASLVASVCEGARSGLLSFLEEHGQQTATLGEARQALKGMEYA